MSDEQQDEQKYGLEGIQQSQGYSPMPMATPDPDPEPALTDEQVAHFNRPAPPPPVERAYNDVQTGEPTPDNQTVELERASKDLTTIREEERQEVERARNEALNRELDDATATLDAMGAAEAPYVEEQPAQLELQQPDLTPQPEFEVPAGLHPEIAQALQSPKVRSLLEHVNLQFEQTKSQYAAATQQLATEAVATLAAIAPELAGMNPQQAAGALQLIAQSNPARAQQIAQTINRAQNLVAQQQQMAAQQQQRQQALAAEQFRHFAAWHDSQSLVNEPPESLKQIQTTVIEEARQAGISEKDMAQAWNSTALRHSFVQNLMADGIKFRLAQRSVSRAAHHPVPHVQRPGSSGEAQTRTQAALAEAQSKLKPSMSAKEAAAYLIARRAAR